MAEPENLVPTILQTIQTTMSRIENYIVGIKQRLHILKERTKETEIRFNAMDTRMNYMQNGIENIIKQLDGVTMTQTH
jgi:flagellar capping protein FliD